MTNHSDSERLSAIAQQFTQNKISNIEAFGSGNINDTFLVTLEESRFILQRINTQVFRQPQLVMQNICVLTQHICDRLTTLKLDRRWETPQVMLTRTNQDYWIDADSSVWRAISFIENSQSFDTIQNQEHAKEIGYALGMFHFLVNDLSPKNLADTLPGFHITPLYLQQYEQVLTRVEVSQLPEVQYGLKFIRDRQAWAHVLETAKSTGKLALRLMHGDPKINNIMIDAATDRAVSVIDLDTVKPGLIHYDIGDCLRSGCNPVGEETENLDSVYFEPELCQSILRGYLSVAKSFFTDQDYVYLYDAIRLIAFELGLRFFTDYLAGNVYFKVKYPEHNLMRSLVQFKLTESIESQEATLRAMIQSLQ